MHCATCPQVTVYFEDRHQDFLWWTLTWKGGAYRVTNCGPFQQSIWYGREIVPTTFRRGQLLKIVVRDEGILTMRYPLIRVEKASATKVAA